MQLRFPAVAVMCVACAFAILPRSASAQAQPYVWKNAQIVGGGFVSGIVTHPTAKGVMYARTDIGGAYRWDADAKVWIPITDWVSGPDWNFTGIESIAVDPSNPDRVYLAAGTYTNFWSPTNGAIFRSDDRGQTWRRSDLPFKLGGNEDGRSNGERLAVDPNHPDTLFFGSRVAGLWKSGDAGVTWTRVQGFPDVATSDSTRSADGEYGRMVGIVCVAFDPRTGGNGQPSTAIYAAVSTPQLSLYRSADGGSTWSAVPGQPTGFKPHRCVLDPHTDALYVAYGNHPGPNGITDGALWKLNTASGQWTDISPVTPGGEDKFGYAGVTVDPQRPGVVMTSTMNRWARVDDIFRSTDGGTTWTGLRGKSKRDASAAPWLKLDRDSVDIGHWIGDIEIDPFDSNHALYITGWGMWRTENLTAVDTGGRVHWTVAARGIEECVVNNVVSPSKGAHVLSAVWDIDGFRHDVLDRSPAAGSFSPHFGRSTDIDFAELDPNTVVRVFGLHHSFDPNKKATGGAVSRDNGVTWTSFATAAPGNGDGFIAVSADGGASVWTPNDGAAHVSRDGGKSWSACAGLPPKLRVISDRARATHFYAFAPGEGRVYVSSDHGATFTPAAQGLPKGDGYLRAPVGQAGHVWLATDEGLYRATDAGATFARVEGVDRARRIGFGRAAGDGGGYPATYVVGHVKGVYGLYRSDDVGATWTRINDDAHQFGTINAITGDPRVFGRVYLASANRGVLYGHPPNSATSQGRR